MQDAFRAYELLDIPVLLIARQEDGTCRCLSVNPACTDITGIAAGDEPGAELAALAAECTASSTSLKRTMALPLANGTQQLDVTIRPAESPLQALLVTLLPATATATALKYPESERFIARAAHDLRTPMRNVQSIAEMLLETLPEEDEDNRKLTEMLMRIGQNGGKMIDEIIDFVTLANQEAVVRTLELDNFVTARLLQQDSDFRHSISAPPIQLECNEPAFCTVIDKLIANALVGASGGNVVMMLEVEQQPDGLLAFHFSDNSRNHEAIAAILSEDRTALWNAGLGLAVMRRIILASGGSLSAGPPGIPGGNALTFRLPGRVLR
ncbi:sensor histidine kinase [Algicella marina]|uniref:histidine kinase n=1 Tax=Algicella marina TaxID=2683284 RepID=A0A6P1SY49_9RHOB|nr:HAMP domain-containing sensor histidine kinase [Algicella marina]QHQ33909.1 hypothetical protein GO499_01290 [Algicella marina]